MVFYRYFDEIENNIDTLKDSQLYKIQNALGYLKASIFDTRLKEKFEEIIRKSTHICKEETYSSSILNSIFCRCFMINMLTYILNINKYYKKSQIVSVLFGSL